VCVCVAPRVCEMCGQAVASLECADCHEDLQVPHHSFYCAACCRTYHQHPKRLNHQPKAIVVNPLFENCLARHVNSQQTGSLDEEMLELYGVICIATSHYVSFVKCGQGDNAPWLFFDSMADRVGEQ
jgi:ubiquitin thioesterase CYLD